MKHSKIFLGATTCVLAVVALAATRAHKFTSKKTGFYVTNANHATCAHQSVAWFTQGTKQAETKSQKYLVYTQLRTAATCSGNVLYSNTTDGD